MHKQTERKPENKVTHNQAAVYVGTYAKYNAGSIRGAWIELDDYAGDREAFLAACAELHKDEQDPEFMFPDYQGFPDSFYGESHLPESLFDWLELNDEERELMARYEDAFGCAASDIDQARDSFVGTYDDGADFAETLADECGDIPKDLSSWVVIDWEASWQRNLRHDYSTSYHDGQLWIFHS